MCSFSVFKNTNNKKDFGGLLTFEMRENNLEVQLYLVGLYSALRATLSDSSAILFAAQR